MAKKKTNRAAPTPPSSTERSGFMESLRTTLTAKYNKKDMYTGPCDSLISLPVPALSMRWLLCNEGLLLSKVYHLTGDPGSFKSTFLAEMMRWFAVCGGLSGLMETENKATPTLRYAVLWDDFDTAHAEACRSMEDWQRRASWLFNAYTARCSRVSGPGKSAPLCIGVDSLMGKLAESTTKKMGTQGHAFRRYADEARMMSDYVRFISDSMVEWPAIFVGVNHRRVGTNPDTGLPERTTPGGWTLKYCEAIELEMSRKREEQREDGVYIPLRLALFKNSYGPGRRTLPLAMRMTREPSPDGQRRLRIRFLWHAATARLLTDPTLLPPPVLAGVKEILNPVSYSGGAKGTCYASDVLGISKSDYVNGEDFGLALERNPVVLAKLYDVLEIERRPLLGPSRAVLGAREDLAYLATQTEDWRGWHG